MENKKYTLAKDYVENTSTNIFLTGKAGTGKTTFLKEIVESSPKRKVVVAPTGVAAINAAGVTLHSFFQLPFGLCLPEYQHIQNFSASSKNDRFRFNKVKTKIIRSMELLIIDEVSMLRADVMDEIDAVLQRIRRNQQPFGGVQVLMIGDMQQLPPVVRREEWDLMRKYYKSPYFFDSKVLSESPYVKIEFDHIYRQRDAEFISLLEAVRDNNLNEEVLRKLNSRYEAQPSSDNDQTIVLTTHNRTADSINESRLTAIDKELFEYSARVVNNFPEHLYPQDLLLVLKVGARVMFTKNDADAEKRFVNGTLATVTNLTEESIEVITDLGLPIDVQVSFWENLKYSINDETKEIVSDIDGLFYQYPIKLAWAITIHKSQGLTFDNAIIDAGDSFSHGQVYVALSRCRTLNGLTLRSKIASNSVITDKTISEFCKLFESECPQASQLELDKRNYFLEQLLDLFDFTKLKRYYVNFKRFAETAAIKIYPKAVSDFSSVELELVNEVFEVGDTFQRSLRKLVQEDYLTNEFLQERISKASVYFGDKLNTYLSPLLSAISNFKFDAKDVTKIYTSYYTSLLEEVLTKVELWNYSKDGFELDEYLSRKALVVLELLESPPKKIATAKSKDTEEALPDIQDAVFFEKLKSWRYDKAKELNVPAYCIAHQKTLIEISNRRPTTVKELLLVKGVGAKFVEKYAQDVLGMCGGVLESIE